MTIGNNKREHYDLVMAQHEKNLIKYMNERMKQGWQPVGGVVVLSSWLCQAVVRTPTLNKELKGQDDD